jgi:uncharacterized membrane protein
MGLFTVFKVLHIIAGFTALLVFWIPIITKKGGKTHVRVGWIYVWAMIVVAVSALYMGTWRIVADPNRTVESVSFAWFLIFISILSSATAWYGIRVLKFKKRSGVHRQPVDLLFSSLLLLSGIGMSVYGSSLHSSLLTWFPWIGIMVGGTQLLYWLRKPDHPMHWWFEHLGGMLGCCIATITAFTVFGAPRLLGLSQVSLFIWFGPTLLMLPVIIGMSVYYRRKFGRNRAHL